MKVLRRIFVVIKQSNLLHNVLNLFVIEGLNFLLPFIALPFLYRVLGVEKYGVIASAYSFYIFANIVIDYGFNLSATREISLNVDKKEELNKVVSSTIVSKMLLLFITIAVCCFIIELSSFREYRIVFYLMMGIPIGNCFFPVWFFQGIEKMAYITTTTSLAKLLSFIPMFIIVRNESDIVWVSVFYSLGFITSGMVSMYILIKRFDIRFVPVRMVGVIQTIKNSSPYFLSRISAAFNGVGNTILIGLKCGSLMAGYYDSAQKIVVAFSTALNPLVTALYPYMIKRRNVVLFRKILIILSMIGLIISLIAAWQAPVILKLLFGEACSETVTILRILLISTSFVVPNYLFGYPLLAAMGHTKYTNYTVILAGILYILVISAAIIFNKFNAVFVASVFVGFEFVVFILRIVGVIRYKTLRIVKKY